MATKHTGWFWQRPCFTPGKSSFGLPDPAGLPESPGHDDARYRPIGSEICWNTVQRVPDKIHTHFEVHRFWILSKDTQVKRGFMAIVAAAVCGVATWGGKRWDLWIFPTQNPLMIEFQWSPPICFLKTHRGTVYTPNSPCKFRSVEGVTMSVWFPSKDFQRPSMNHGSLVELHFPAF